MIDINKIRVGLSVEVEDNGFVIPGVIMVIDPEREVVGVKTVFSNDTRTFSPGKVYFRYPCHNGREPEFSGPSPKDKNLLHLLGGYVVALASGESSLATAKEVAEEIRKFGLAREGARAQEVIAALR